MAWARFAAETPHSVFSSSLTTAAWPTTVFIRSLEDIAALKQRPGKDIYLIGGGCITASLMEVGLLDEIRLITYPVVAGDGPLLFSGLHTRRALDLRAVQPRDHGRVYRAYAIS